MIKITVIGAAGRMGKNIIELLSHDPGLQLVGAIEYSTSPSLGLDAGNNAGLKPLGVVIGDDFAKVSGNTDVVIDFSSAQSVLAHTRQAVSHGCGVVIGTTGLDAGIQAEIRKLAEQGGRIVLSPNMSVGVNLLFHLCRQVAKTLGDDYDIEIIEMHHNKKKDAPSGTAVRLGEIVAQARELDYQHDTRHGREGMVGERTRREIGMHALRGGDVIGDHQVIFASEGERIELAHKASSRSTFAKGALVAAKFIAQAPPGLYSMLDVLNINTQSSPKST